MTVICANVAWDYSIILSRFPDCVASYKIRAYSLCGPCWDAEGRTEVCLSQLLFIQHVKFVMGFFLPAPNWRISYKHVREISSLFSCDPTTRRPDQLTMTPKVFSSSSKYSINIFHVVKFIFKNLKSCKHDMHEKWCIVNNKIFLTCFVLKNAIFKRISRHWYFVALLFSYFLEY